MSMVTAQCPHCQKNIQIPDDVEETYCAYCGKKIQTDNAVLSSTNIVLDELKGLRDQELNDFLQGPGFQSIYRGWGLPTKYNAQIEEMDPRDVLSKELRICGEIRNLLFEGCGEKGVFSPAGIRYIGSKVIVSQQFEPYVIQHIESVNRDALALLSVIPGYDFTPTKKLFLDIVKLDKTPELYNTFSNGLVLALLSLQHFFIPVVRRKLLAPLGERMAEGFNQIAEMITLNMEPGDLAYTEKVKILKLNTLSLLK